MVENHMFGFGGPLMWLFWILLIVVIIWIVKLAFGSGNSSERKENSALEILQQRYARGEIDREEYEQKKRDLSN